MPSITITYSPADATRIRKAMKKINRLDRAGTEADIKAYLEIKLKGIVREVETREAAAAARVPDVALS